MTYVRLCSLWLYGMDSHGHTLCHPSTLSSGEAKELNSKYSSLYPWSWPLETTGITLSSGGSSLPVNPYLPNDLLMMCYASVTQLLSFPV